MAWSIVLFYFRDRSSTPWFVTRRRRKIFSPATTTSKVWSNKSKCIGPWLDSCRTRDSFGAHKTSNTWRRSKLRPPREFSPPWHCKFFGICGILFCFWLPISLKFIGNEFTKGFTLPTTIVAWSTWWTRWRWSTTLAMSFPASFNTSSFRPTLYASTRTSKCALPCHCISNHLNVPFPFWPPPPVSIRKNRTRIVTTQTRSTYSSPNAGWSRRTGTSSAMFT